MTALQPMKQLDDPQTFYRYLRDIICNLDELRAARKHGQIDRAFIERIMLAVTQVNGCRYCSYHHTKVALEAGLASEEIAEILNGELGATPQDELVALIYAQHYAESKAHPDPAATRRLVDVYGQAVAREILAYVRVIMVGNVYGAAFDDFQHRLRRQAAPGSNLGREAGILLGSVAVVPALLLQHGLNRLFHGKPQQPVGL